MAAKPRTIDQILAAVSDDQRAALEKLRKTIQAAAPKAEECISYGLAAFRLNGKPLVAFGASANHCAFYPMNSTTVLAYKDELKHYDTSKGTIRFTADKPLPAALVRKLVKARVAENALPRNRVAKPGTEGSQIFPAVGAIRNIPSLPGKDQLQTALSWLRAKSTKHDRENLTRFAISTNKFFGVSMANMKVLARKLGRNHELAAALWDTGWHEARMLATMVDEPAQVTAAQMDHWCRDFDNWAICDTACFCLFDRTSHAWGKVARWGNRKEEFVKRTAFALLWSLTVHDKVSGDEPFLKGLVLIERAATDERHFVKKAVNMALRAIGKRSPTLHAAAATVAERLADSPEPAARWVGKDALRELTSAKVRAWMARRGR